MRVIQSMGLVILIAACWSPVPVQAAEPVLKAGVAKVDIADPAAGPPNDPLSARVLILSAGETSVALVAVDAVAIGEIGPIRNEYMATVRAGVAAAIPQLEGNIVVNASHCHGLVCADVAERTVKAIQEAWGRLEPVRIAAGTGTETRIMENRRLRLKSGRETDIRHAYALPADDEVAGLGPVDPKIGILRVDRLDGRTLGLLYQFACHPIQGAASGKNTADFTGISSRVIEENLPEGAVALFFQGCGGDINPVTYKNTHEPRDCEPLGNLLALSTLKASRSLSAGDTAALVFTREVIEMPRADLAEPIAALEAERDTLVEKLGGTTLSLKTFLPLVAKYRLDTKYPSAYAHEYLRELRDEKNDLTRMDAENRKAMDAYIQNVLVMEEIARVRTNLALMKRHHAKTVAAGSRTIPVEVTALRVGDFRLVTFPGELVVQIGLNIQSKAKHPLTFVSGYTNGYIYYCPTEEQLRNRGHAQEDSDCLLAPEWQAQFEGKAAELLSRVE
jgi:hypothetical protein